MPDLPELLARWWKQVALTVILATITAALVCYFQPRLYKSEVTAIAASSFSNDRNRVFSENLQSLYSSLGTPDDLDLIIGTGQLDTVYRAVAIRLDPGENTGSAVIKSARKLRGQVRVKKSAYGELVIQAWDKEAARSARIANEVFQVLQEIHQALQNTGNEITLRGLLAGRKKLEMERDSIHRAGTLTQLDQYDKLIGQYQVLVDSRPPVLHAVEMAQPADRPDKPKTRRVIFFTIFLSFLFGLLVAVVLEAKRRRNLQ